MNTLSLFDGMACGALAMQAAGIKIDSYNAYEIDKYAIKTACHNFPIISQHGDVFAADFTQFEGVDLVCGGSPCTYWSIAQKNNRETEASGMGWKLFQQYARAIKEAKPKYFIYENNKSMSNAIRESISDTFGFEPILINSALVSAQNRQRLYWVGMRKSNGGYTKINIELPEDRGILLRDILESGVTDKEKAYCLKHQAGNARDYLKKHHTQVAFEPVCVAQRGRYMDSGNRHTKCNGPTEQFYEARTNGKTNALTTVQKDNNVAVPIYVGELPGNNGIYRNGKQPSQQYRVYSVYGKSVCCDNDSRKYYAEPVDGNSSAVPIYEVQNGFINHNGHWYPIKLADGFYIIRKLTVRECARLQTVPEWYSFPVSDTQAYKMLGNSWTVEVIAHIMSYMKGVYR